MCKQSVKPVYIGLMFLIMSLTSVLLTPSVTVAEWGDSVYYVATTGDDSNAGTIEAPWRTIQKAADTLEPGEMVFVRGGLYKESVKIQKSGSKDGHILYKAFPGEQPVLDGTGMEWDSKKSALLFLSNVSYIIIDGFEVRNLETDSSDTYPAGIRIREGGSHIQLLNNNVHHIANKSQRGNAHGIHIYGNSTTELSDILIKGNEVHHLTLGSSEALTVSGNVTGFLIEDNRVHDNNNIGIDIAGFYNACKEDNCTDQARNGKIIRNKVFNNSSGKNPSYKGDRSAAGIYADGATDIIIENNIVHDNDYGISLASEKYGKQTSYIKVWNNLIYENNSAGIVMGGSSSSNGGTANNIIIHNVLKHNNQLSQGYGEITLQWNNFDNQIIYNDMYSDKKKDSLIKQGNTGGAGNSINNNQTIYAVNFVFFKDFATKLMKHYF